MLRFLSTSRLWLTVVAVAMFGGTEDKYLKARNPVLGEDAIKYTM